jgi:hypothetical protein
MPDPDSALVTAPAAGATTAAATTAATATTTTAADTSTALVTPPAPAAGPNDWMPEKFRVVKDDGTLDEAASARNLAKSYTELEKVRPEPPPKDVADYKLEKDEGIDGVDFDEFKKDPLAQGFLKGAHAKGMTNAQVNYTINEYLKIAPQLFDQNAKLTAAEAKTELGKLWADPVELDRQLVSSKRAFMGFGGEADDMPGSRKRLFEKFGSDADFIAFAARVSQEMGEDKLPNGGGGSDVDIDALMKSKAYFDPSDPQHAIVKAKVTEHFNRKHGI